MKNLLTTFYYFVIGPQYNDILTISGDTAIYRIEKRAVDSVQAKDFYGQEFDYKRKWEFLINSNEALSSLMAKYKDNEIHEYRIRNFKFIN